jgi:hypothetical protein
LTITSNVTVASAENTDNLDRLAAEMRAIAEQFYNETDSTARRNAWQEYLSLSDQAAELRPPLDYRPRSS